MSNNHQSNPLAIPESSPSNASPENYNRPSFQSDLTHVVEKDVEQVDDDNDLDLYKSSTNPLSPFYSHPTTRTSLEQLKSESRIYVTSATSTSTLSPVSTSQTSKQQSPPPPLPPYNSSNPLPQKPKDTVLKKAATMWPTPYTNTNTKSSSPNRKIRRRMSMRKNLTGTVRGSRACAPYRRLSRNQKWCLHLLIALLVVGLGVGLGIGISKAVGAGVWKSNNSSYDIPGEKSG